MANYSYQFPFILGFNNQNYSIDTASGTHNGLMLGSVKLPIATELEVANRLIASINKSTCAWFLNDCVFCKVKSNPGLPCHCETKDEYSLIPSEYSSFQLDPFPASTLVSPITGRIGSSGYPGPTIGAVIGKLPGNFPNRPISRPISPGRQPCTCICEPDSRCSMTTLCPAKARPLKVIVNRPSADAQTPSPSF